MRSIKMAAVLAVLAAASQGCTDNRTTFFVRSIMVPTMTDDGCEIPADRAALTTSSGEIDLALRASYFLFPLIENAMLESNDLVPITSESNRIALTGAEVRLSLENGEPLSNGSYFIPVSGIVEPGGVTSLAFEAIPAGYLDDATHANQMIIIEFRMLGTTGGGMEIDTPWFAYPVYTCLACMVVLSNWSEERGCYDCWDTEGSDAQVPCKIGQDAYVDCSLCVTWAPACQSADVCPRP